MFSYGEIFTIIVVAGVVLNKKDIVNGSRILGKAVGRFVGKLQGISIKYEEGLRENKLHSLHKNIRQGLNELNSVRSDLMYVGNARMISGLLLDYC